jgi:hypothetical protein
MNFIKLKSKNIFIYLIFFLILLVGINIYKDYGLTLDDEIYRLNGQIYYEYIKILLVEKNLYSLNNLESLSLKFSGTKDIIYHPVLFELILAIFADILNARNTKEIFELSHILNFSIFFVSMIVFYKIILNKFNSEIYSIFAVLIIFFSPRIFAETFYNSRDIFFLSLFIFNIYSATLFLTKQNLKTSLFFSFTSALLINAKVLGLGPPVIFLFLFFLNKSTGKNTNESKLKYIFIIPLMTIFFMYISWPLLWSDPFYNFTKYLTWIINAQNSLVLQNLYLGNYISSTVMPWHYRIVWFFITTPVFVSIFFIVGFILVIFNFFKNLMKLDNNNDNLWINNDQMFDFFLTSILLTTIVGSIIGSSSQFGGWRHLYFLYPIIIMNAIYGFDYINHIIKVNKIKLLILFFILINFSYLLFWNYKNHPHQQVFFNSIIKKFVKNNFDLDYWGLSNIYSLKYIIETNENFPIKVGTVSFSRLKDSYLFLNEENKKKISLIGDFNLLNDADYLITNYMKRFRNNFIINNKNYIKYFEIVVDGMPINTVYKKIN